MVLRAQFYLKRELDWSYNMAKKKRVVRRKQPQSIVTDDLFIPNHSGMLDSGKVHRTPTDDLDPVNKKYVDDEIAGVGGGIDADIIVVLDGAVATLNGNVLILQ